MFSWLSPSWRVNGVGMFSQKICSNVGKHYVTVWHCHPSTPKMNYGYCISLAWTWFVCWFQVSSLYLISSLVFRNGVSLQLRGWGEWVGFSVSQTTGNSIPNTKLLQSLVWGLGLEGSCVWQVFGADWVSSLLCLELAFFVIPGFVTSHQFQVTEVIRSSEQMEYTGWFPQ